jgi:hypothetical protein
MAEEHSQASSFPLHTQAGFALSYAYRKVDEQVKS